MTRREFVHVNIGAAMALKLSSAGLRNDITAAEFHSLRRFVNTSYGRISFIDIGQGPTALFLHGFPLNSFQWRGVIPRLSSIRRCIAPDFLALGYTEVADGQRVDPETQLAMLLEFLEKLSIRTVDIVANDSGGAIAQLLVAHHPERVNSLLLTNCDTEPDSPPKAVLPVIELGKTGRFADEWLARWLANKALARSETGLGGQCYADPAHPTDEAIEVYLAPLVSSPRRKQLTNAYAASLYPNPLAGIESALKGCYVSVRIMWGSGDTIFSQSSADYLDCTFLESYGVRRLPGAKLFFPEEIPQVIAEEAESFWRACVKATRKKL